MINFENDRRKNPGLGIDQICHIIGVKPSSFDRQIQDFNLPHRPNRYDVTGKGKKQQSTNDNTNENINNCTECNKTYKTPSSFKAHNTKFHKVNKDQKVKETSLKDNVGKGKELLNMSNNETIKDAGTLNGVYTDSFISNRIAQATNANYTVNHPYYKSTEQALKELNDNL